MKNSISREPGANPECLERAGSKISALRPGCWPGFAADGVSAAGSRTAGENVAGSPYTISATLSPFAVVGNYPITYNTAQFAITKAALGARHTRLVGRPPMPIQLDGDPAGVTRVEIDVRPEALAVLVP